MKTINTTKKNRTKSHIYWMLTLTLFANNIQAEDWPVLKHYDKDHLHKIAMPVGGIGTGTISLAGNGALKDWEIGNVAPSLESDKW